MRTLETCALALCASLVTTASAEAQYFGRNKVQYEHLDFRVLPTAHFDLYFYPVESLPTVDASRMAERWYHRHRALLQTDFRKNPLIFYADQPDFQQSNVIEDFIGQGTGGVTESTRDRVIMPFTGVYAETDHVLGHELVHVFQYHMARASQGGEGALNSTPLWLIEGMAEYLSVGRRDPHTAMWLRDALRRNDLPTVRQLSTESRFFPYRFGQALWAYIAGERGDEVVRRLYTASLNRGLDAAIDSAVGMNEAALSRAWHAAIRDEYGTLADRTAPDRVGRGVAVATRAGDQNVSPSISPDGRRVAFFSSRGLFGFDIYVADVGSGRILKRLTSVVGGQHFDALSFIATAGTWSPDGQSLAFVVYAEGNNRIEIVNVSTGRTARRIRPPGLGAISDPAWSPDGRYLVFSGQQGGVSDLYRYDLEDGTMEQLTQGREAELQPAWSPDGRTIAFATDRGRETNMDSLRYGFMRLAVMDVATREIQLLPRFGDGKQINPQYSADGASLFFVSDQDGVSDVYRRVQSTGETYRVTRIATGVSGITALAPTMSVARSTGLLAFSVFDRAGFSIRALPAPEAQGAPATPVASATSAGYLGMLPSRAAFASSMLERALANPSSGLPTAPVIAVHRYRGGLFPEYVQAASIGMSFGGGYGTGVGGGVAIGFTDMVGNRIAQAVVQAQGQVEDIGAQAIYLDRTRRWNWGLQAYHVPVAGVYASYENVPLSGGGAPVAGTVITQQLQRVFFDDAQGLAQYPLSATRRLEFSGGVQRVSFSAEVDSLYLIGGAVVRETRNKLPTDAALTFYTGSLAYVGDRSFFGFTSPVAGARYRVEGTPYAGSLTYQTLLADYRHYFFMRPFTVAVRGLHVGRYGRDGESPRLQSMFIGQSALLRGYEAEDFSASECVPASDGADACPQFSRLAGSRLAVLNAEFRIPLVGNDQFGLLPWGFLPVEVAPFVDAGVAWTRDESASWRFDNDTPDRVPVVSAGVATRLSLFNAFVLEVFWVHPFQRPGRGGYVGFQLTPGW